MLLMSSIMFWSCHTSATEQTDLAALANGRIQVDNLDAGFEQVHRRDSSSNFRAFW